MKLSPFNWLAMSFFGFFCSYGVFMPFFPVWLKSQSYDAETIGLILSSAYIFRFIGGIAFVGFIKQASQLIPTLRYLAWATFATILVLTFTIDNFWMLCLCVAIFSTLNSAGIPLGDTLATTWQRQVSIDYGKVRLIGSLAFAIGVTCFGYVIGLVGEKHIGLIICALLLTYSCVQMIPPALAPQDQAQPKQTLENSTTENSTANPPSFLSLLKNRTTVKILTVVALIQGSHAAYYVYSVIYWTHDLNISVQTTSILWGLSVVAEVIFFFYSSRLLKSWSTSAMLYVSAIACAIRWALFGYADNIIEILPLQLMHCLTFALSHFAIMRYIAMQPQNSIAKLQGLYNAISGCAALALLMVLVSYIYPVSPLGAFLTMAGFSVLALPFVPRKMKDIRLQEVN